MSYKCLGDNRYEITMDLFIDCSTVGAANFDRTASIGIFLGDDLLVNRLVAIGPTEEILVEGPRFDCQFEEGSYCLQKGTYTLELELPSSPDPYRILYQRCCLAEEVVNVDNPGARGLSLMAEITPLAQSLCNSSPEIDFPLSYYSCPNVPMSVDLMVQESDGDSVAYQLCMPFLGGGLGGSPSEPNKDANGCDGVVPSPPCPPPFETMPFAGTFDLDNPFPTQDGVSLDSQTGQLSYTPTDQGMFVFGICFSEYRNGQLLGTYRHMMSTVNRLGIIISTEEVENAATWSARYQAGADQIQLFRSDVPASEAEVQLINLNGQVLQSSPLDGQQKANLSVGQYSAGLYLVRIREANQEQVLKVAIWR
ncbi:MAG: T9SS type A sorting domain-containing protein [Bacteroidota bacterium]